MYNFSKDGIVVSTVLDARTANKEGKYPVKIKVYYYLYIYSHAFP
jgi:integrase/recombinase XerD